jgi:hypothetical protein
LGASYPRIRFTDFAIGLREYPTFKEGSENSFLNGRKPRKRR